MKLKKLSGLLSAVLAGAMVLSMAPAAFAAAKCEHIQQVGVDNGDGTCSYICARCAAIIDTTAHVWDKDGTCVRCDAKKPATDTSDCNHTGNHWTFEDNHNGTHNVVCADCKTVVSENVACTYEDGVCITCGATKPEEVGTTYTVIDATHHHVHAVYEDGTVYDADVPCVFETGTCVCGNTCPHSTFKYENNGNGTHKVICAECGAVVTEAAECVYGEDGKGTCACGAEYACDHMGNHWKYVDNGDGTHNVVCADCGAVVSANVACNYKNGVCITCGAKQPAKADDGIATKPGYGPLDPNFSVGYHPICEFFRAVFRFLFGRH